MGKASLSMDGVETFVLKEGKEFDGVAFPLGLRPAADAWDSERQEKWIADNYSRLLDELLVQHGAVLLRGFAVPDAQSFHDLIEQLRLPNFPYVGGNAVRTKVVGERVFTANESPPDRKIPFHHELAQASHSPSRLLFYCHTPAPAGGETPIAPSATVAARLAARHPRVMSRLEREGVVYSRVMTEHDRAESAIGRGWKATFDVATRREVEERLAREGSGWEWVEEPVGRLREVSAVRDAVRVDARTGRKVFFNQVWAAYTGWADEFNTPEQCVRLGGGDAMPEEFMEDLGKVLEETQVAFQWEAGDVLLIDNTTVMHARQTFSGKRVILASLAA